MRRTVPSSAEIEAQIDELLAVGVGENPRESKTSSGRDMTVGGAELAGQAIRMGWSMSSHLFLTPIVVGGGKRAVPDNLGLPLELLGERRSGSGVVHLHYRLSL